MSANYNLGSAVGEVRIDFDGSAVEEGAERGFGGMEGRALAAVAVITAAFGALAAGIASALNVDSLNRHLGAALDLPPSVAEAAGRTASDAYAAGFGESLEDSFGAVQAVISNLGSDLDPTDLQAYSEQALAISEVFGVDVSTAVTQVGQLVRTGMVPDIASGFDFLTSGLQTFDGRADDFMDTIQEYGVQFEGLGVTGQQALGLISQGLEGGARNTDLIADALKEFGIRAKDGSQLTADGFAAVGLSAGDMGAQIAAGGETANGALDATLDALRNMTDPVARNEAAVALFGTQAEDLGTALFNLDPSSAAAVGGLDNTAGAAGRLGDAVTSGPQEKLEQLGRTISGGITAALGNLITGFEDGGASADGFDGFMQTLGGSISDVVTGLTTAVEWAQDNAEWLGPLAVGIGAAATAYGLMTGAMILFNSAGAIMAAVQGAINTVLLANPIILIIALIAGLIAALVFAYQNSETFRDIVDAALSAVGDVFSWLWGVVQSVAEWIVGAWNWVRDAAVTVKDAIVTAWNAVISFFQGIPGWISGVFSSAVSWLVNAGGNIISGLWNGIQNLWGTVTGWFGGLGSTVMSLLSGAASWLYDAGRNVIQGFWNGLKNVVGSVWDWIRDWAGGLIDDVMGLLGINSPSVVFMEMGQYLMQGLQLGIENEAKAATDAATDAALAVVDAYNGALAPDSFATMMAANGLSDGMVTALTGSGSPALSAAVPASWGRGSMGDGGSGSNAPVINTTVHAPQTMDPQQVGDAVAARTGFAIASATSTIPAPVGA